jgi:hypothetical protein
MVQFIVALGNRRLKRHTDPSRSSPNVHQHDLALSFSLSFSFPLSFLRLLCLIYPPYKGQTLTLATLVLSLREQNRKKGDRKMISFADVPPEIMQAMITPMHLIPLPVNPGSSNHRRGSLYLGSLSASIDYPLLESHRITHVVQVLDAAWLDPTAQQKFQCYNIKVREGSTPTIQISDIIKSSALMNMDK